MVCVQPLCKGKDIGGHHAHFGTCRIAFKLYFLFLGKSRMFSCLRMPMSQFIVVGKSASKAWLLTELQGIVALRHVAIGESAPLFGHGRERLGSLRWPRERWEVVQELGNGRCEVCKHPWSEKCLGSVGVGPTCETVIILWYWCHVGCGADVSALCPVFFFCQSPFRSRSSKRERAMCVQHTERNRRSRR